jgi:hypothetical protein
MSRENEAFLAKLALEKGYITPEQLNECVRLQEEDKFKGDPNVTRGRRVPTRPLGTVLVAKGYLTDERLLELYEEQQRRLESMREYRLIQQGEFLLGQLLVQHNKATQIQVNKCLEHQRRMAEMGTIPVPRLGEIMVDHGFVDGETVARMLELQNKRIMVCTGCRGRFNVVGVEPGRAYRCRKCGGTLVSSGSWESVKVDETAFGIEAPDLKKEGGPDAPKAV